MKRIFLPVFITLGLSVSGQAPFKAKLDSLMNLLDKNNSVMGTLSLFKDGREIYNRSIGYASIEKSIKADENTVYRIGSISKTFTAVIIMKLVEEGRLSLGTHLARYFPEIPYSNEITIEQLLRHRSGIFNFTDAPDYASWMEHYVSRETLLSKILSYEPEFRPGKGMKYSNTNYVLLSYIAEKITKQPYDRLVEKYICGPCSLEKTRYGGEINVDQDEAMSYQHKDKWIPATETNMSIPSGAGGLVSTPSDLNKFLYCLFNGKLVSDSSLSNMMTMEDGYGLGIFQVPFYDKVAYGHAGGIDGFQSNAFYFPDEKFSVSFLANGVDFPLNEVLIGVLSIYFGRDYTFPRFRPAVQVSPEELNKYTGVYSDQDFPLKLTIRVTNGHLEGQATGQPAFPLEATGDDIFSYNAAGIIIQFIPDENKLILNQMDKKFELFRK